MISVKVSSIIVNYGDINVNLFYYGFLIGLFLVWKGSFRFLDGSLEIYWFR